MIAALMAVLALQQGGLQVLTSLDRDRVVPGDEVLLSITVLSTSSVPIQVNVPTMNAFVLLGREEETDVVPGSPGNLTTSIKVRLRADKPGTWRLGPFMVRQGKEFAQGDAVTLEVEGGGSAASTAVSPRLGRLLERARPPGGLKESAVTVLVSVDSVVVGEQVDVVAIAWFDREIRQQLRRAPTVEAPRMEGVWSYPQPVPGGIAASRQVAGRWYDLFVLHQVVFPLQPGTIVVAPARLQYSLPLAFQFFSQEERYSLLSDSARIRVTPVPQSGRPLDFAGAVGHDLSVTQTLTPPFGHQGEAFTLEISVKGSGNVALWPLPAPVWPSNLRAYSEGSRDDITVRDGQLGGRKTFRYLLVPDSAGSVRLPPVRYSYYDPAGGGFRSASADAMTLQVASGGEAHAARPAPPEPRQNLRVPVTTRLHSLLSGAAEWLVWLVPVLGFLARRYVRPRQVVPEPVEPADPLADAEQRLDRLLARLIEDPVERESDVKMALQRSGIPTVLAGRVARVRSAIRGFRYGGVHESNPTALVNEANAVLRLLAARPDRRRRSVVPLALAGLMLSGGASLEAQRGIDLYHAGAYRAAGDVFAAEAARTPLAPTAWVNLGAARYREGDDAGALAAWVKGARLRPRDPVVRRSLALVPPADPSAGRWLWVSPATPDELWFGAVAAWLVGWISMALRRRMQGRWVVLLAGALLVAAFSAALREWYQRPLAVVRVPGSLRLSPHELAPSRGELARLAVVEVIGSRGVWRDVVDPDGRRGWVEQDQLSPIAR